MTLSPTMRQFLVAMAVLSAVGAGWRLAESFSPDELYRKDFIQEYVLAKATLAGEEPYLPMPDMVARWFDPAKKVNWSHPTPHTPVTAVLSIPVAWLDYPLAAFLWLVFELVLLIAVWVALFRWWGDEIAWPTRIILVLLSMSLGPVIQELWFGNLSMILLALLIPAWLALRSGRDVIGGAWLGLAIAIKLTAWPVILFLLVKRRWQAVAAAAAIIVGLHIVALAVLGPGHVVDYYLRVGPGIALGYRQHDGNYSLWSVSGRLFAADFDSVISTFVAWPPWPSPMLDQSLKAAFPIAGLLIGLALALACREFDSSFGILLCVSLPVNPVAWDHSLLIVAIPIAIVLRRLSWAKYPRGATALAIVCFGLTMFPQKAYVAAVVGLFATKRDDVAFLPFAAGLVTYVPLIALVGWMWLLWRMDGIRYVVNGNAGRVIGALL